MRAFALSFVATLGVGVPAAWHVLAADVEHGGKKLRPMQQSFTVDGTKITLDVDRSLVVTGDAVTASLRAFGPVKQVAIDLDLLHANTDPGERVSFPPTQIDHEKLVLTAAPDGGPAVTSRLVLGKRPTRLAQTDTFQVYVTSHGHKADKVEMGMSDVETPDFAGDVQAGNAAAVNIMGWSGNSLPIEIAAEGPVTLSAPFVVAVTIKNTTGHTLEEVPPPSLATQISAGGFLDTSDEDAWQIEQIDREEIDLKPGETRTTRYRVTPNHATGTQVTLVVEAAAFRSRPGRPIAGAMDVVTFPIVEAPTPTVATAK